MEIILRIPRAVINSILNAESDWIRYGLPAVVLTIIFSALMLSKPASEPRESLQGPSHSTGAEGAQVGRQRTGTENGSASEQPALAPSLSVPESANAFSKRPPSTDVSAAAGSRQKELAAEAVKWGWRDEGRRALCQAVRDSLPDFKAGKLHKHRVVHLARSTFRGDHEMADQAVDQALVDYARGTWSEAQCPEEPGHGPMSKGTIDAVVNRKQDWLKSH